MHRGSWMNRKWMGDQQLGDNLDRNSANSVSIAVQRPWARDDKEEWPDAAQWIREQCDRLHAIVGNDPGDES